MNTTERAFTQPVTVKTWTYVEDSLGNKERSVATEIAYLGRLEQTDSREILIGQSTEISNWRVGLPSGAVVDAEDQVIVGAQTFEVLGPPALEHDFMGRPDHVVVLLRVIT